MKAKLHSRKAIQILILDMINSYAYSLYLHLGFILFKSLPIGYVKWYLIVRFFFFWFLVM